MRLLVMLAMSLFVSACATQQSQDFARSCYHQNKNLEQGLGRCAAVRVGNMLYISGVSGEGEHASAMEAAYRDLGRVLQSHGLSFDNVVSERVYTTNVTEFVKNKAIRKAYFGELLPAASWLEVSRFYQKDRVLELEVTVVIPSTSKFDIISYDSW
ncbi:MAG: RidA family protein [Agarilytica sp.]